MGDADISLAKLDAFMAAMTTWQQDLEDKIMGQLGDLTSQLKLISIAIRKRELFHSQDVVGKQDFSQAVDPHAATSGQGQPLRGIRNQSKPTSSTRKSSNNGGCPPLAPQKGPASSRTISFCKQLSRAKRLAHRDNGKKVPRGCVCQRPTFQILNNLFVNDFCSNHMDIFGMVLDFKWLSILRPMIWDPGSFVVEDASGFAGRFCIYPKNLISTLSLRTSSISREGVMLRAQLGG